MNLWQRADRIQLLRMIAKTNNLHLEMKTILLALREIKGQTASDISNALKQLVADYGIDVQKIVNICCDNCHTMIKAANEFSAYVNGGSKIEETNEITESDDETGDTICEEEAEETN